MSSATFASLDLGLPSVVVIVSHYNSARTIGKCIRCLLEQDYPKELSQIIVVDAGSTDGSQEIVKKFSAPNLTQLVKPGVSEAEGQQIAVRSSSSDAIMFTNSDIYVPRSWVKEHVDWLLCGYDLVGGKVFWGGDKYSFTWNMPTPKGPQFVQKQGMGLGFSNCSVKRDVLVRSGGIRNMVSQQDTEFAFRVVRGGGKMVLDPAIEVYHDHPLGSFRTCFRRSFRYARNHVGIMRASYGRIVMGFEQLTTVSVLSVIREFVKEWFGINGVRAYYEHRPRAAQVNLDVSPLRFLFIRLFSTKLGELLGGFVGVVKIRGTAFDSVVNAHETQPSKHPDGREVE